ncbi:MAG: hypothetical protein E8D49_10385 [Nitrospira sp.]|nr:MAG: hypothetical protein E8D49_10385 [Nitrospira sp.]
MKTRESELSGKWFAALTSAVLIGLLPLGSARAESIPALSEIPIASATAYPDLVTRRAVLVAARTVLRGRTEQHNSRCHSVVAESPEDARCESARAALAADVNRHIEASNQFIAKVERARIITSMNTLAARLGWTADERARLNKALNKLGFDGDPAVTGTQIRRAWQDVLAREQGGELAQKASQGESPGFPGAGEQTQYHDCVVFALANAAGLPYGVTATRATDLISQGDWRSIADRANPQQVIEGKGLTGGEVIMLAEAFGQAEVVPSSAFTKTLTEGRPVMVNVVPEDGDVSGGHEVVLTRAFQHGGVPWYEMMDSNQGAQRRLYINAGELNTLLKENGVAIQPEPGTTPKLLRMP